MTMLMDLEGGHGRNMGAAGIAIGLGAALGAPIGGQLTEVDPLAPLLVAAGLLVFVGIAVSLVEDRTPDERRSARALVDGIRRRPTLSIPFAFGFVDRLTAGFFALVGTLYFQEAFGLDAGTTGLMLACFFAPFALLQYPMGALSGSDRADDSDRRRLAVLRRWDPPRRGLAVGRNCRDRDGRRRCPRRAGRPATMALVTDLADESERGIAMAGFNLAGSLGFLGGFLLGGTVASSYGYGTAFLVVGGLEIAIAVVTVPLFCDSRSRQPIASDRATAATPDTGRGIGQSANTLFPTLWYVLT